MAKPVIRLTAQKIAAILRKAGWKASKRIGSTPWGDPIMSVGVTSLMLNNGWVLVRYCADHDVRGDKRIREEEDAHTQLIDILTSNGVIAKPNIFLKGIACTDIKEL